MKAGPELDNLMATEVMGWVRHDYTAPILGTDDVERWTEWTDKAGCFKAICGVWKPSEDIAAAWPLIEKMRTEDPFGIFPRFIDVLAEMFDADQGAYEADLFNVLGNLDARTICIAMLKAKGIEIEE